MDEADMPDRSVSESDVRFQFEVIRNLAESNRQVASSVERLTNTIGNIQHTQVGMLERLAKIEANRVNEEVADLRARHEMLNGRVDVLELNRAKQEGVASAKDSIIKWWPAFAGLFTVVFLILRAVGIIKV